MKTLLLIGASDHKLATVALVGFLALACCDAIFSSHLSSFSLLAACFGGVPLCIVWACESSCVL